MSEAVEKDLPNNWRWENLKNLGEWSGGGTPYKSNPKFWSQRDIPWVSPKDMKVKNIVSSQDYISKTALEKTNLRLLPERSILMVTRSGILAHSFPVAINDVPVTVNQDLKALVLSKELNDKYVYYALKRYERAILKECSKHGTTVHSIEMPKLMRFQLPVAPAEQQKRIVAKIEELFSHIDSGIEALKKAKQLLKQYRQSVLKAAVTGELTKEWREANKVKLEPAYQLLERILKERRQKWEEQQLEQFEAKGKMPKDDKWKGKYKDPDVPDASDLPMLPGEWLWSGFEQVSSPEKNGMKAGPFGSALKKQFYVEKGYKIYGQEQVINNNPYYGDYYIDEEKYQSLINCTVKPGDFLISLVGTIGRTLVLPDDIEPGIINPRLIKITFNKTFCLPEYVQIYVASPAAKQIFRLSSHGGTMDVLNMGTLKALPLPLPPVLEQQTIVELVKEKEDAIERQINYIQNQLILIEKNKRSILASAFSGRLFESNQRTEDEQYEEAQVL